MNYLDLFSGIGGFALGAYMAGMKADNHFYSDIDKFCVELYGKRFPDSIPLGDITKIDFEQLKNNYKGDWIITGGFPCQDISIAGKGVGINGKRSGLWFTMCEAIRILRPKYVIAENVSAITFRGLDRVLSSLAEVGYDVEWQDIRASDVDAPHRRERLWIVAYPMHERLSGLQQSDTNTIQVSREKKLSELCVASYDKRWLQDTSSFVRVDDGLPRKMDRVRSLGNAIVPQIAEMLFRKILEEKE